MRKNDTINFGVRILGARSKDFMSQELSFRVKGFEVKIKNFSLFLSLCSLFFLSLFHKKKL